MGKTEGKRRATKQKETEEQLPKCDYKEALLTDMKSQIECVRYRTPRLRRLPRKVHAFWGRFINFYKMSPFPNSWRSL